MRATRDRLVTAATELFRVRGYHGTGLKDVTDAAAATTGSLYHFFPGGKVDLADTVIAESGAAYQQLFELIADEAGDAASAVRAFFDGAAEALEQSGFDDTCPIVTVAGEVAGTDERLRRAADDVFVAWTAAATRRFVADGVPADSARDLASTAVTALCGAIVIARCRHDAAPLRVAGAFVADAVAAQVAAAGARRRRGARSGERVGR